jgi:RNA polymerase sigma-70 factor (ECF subfamily)
VNEAAEKDLIQLLLDEYDDLLRRLTRGLGSRDLASEALQETYLRLERGGLGEVRKPRSYLLRMAFNIAKNRQRTENHYVPAGGAEAFEDAVDDSPDPARAAEAQSELRALQVALAQLSPTRRAIFEAAYIRDESLPSIADRHGISLRTVHRELARALEHVHDAWEDSFGETRRKSPRRGV